jgi:hypothetical protein
LFYSFNVRVRAGKDLKIAQDAIVKIVKSDNNKEFTKKTSALGTCTFQLPNGEYTITEVIIGSDPYEVNEKIKIERDALTYHNIDIVDYEPFEVRDYCCIAADGSHRDIKGRRKRDCEKGELSYGIPAEAKRGTCDEVLKKTKKDPDLCCVCFVSKDSSRDAIDLERFNKQCRDWLASPAQADCATKQQKEVDSYDDLCKNPATNCPATTKNARFYVAGHSYSGNFECVFDFCEEFKCTEEIEILAAGCGTCQDYSDCVRRMNSYSGTASTISIIGNVWLSTDFSKSLVLLRKSAECRAEFEPMMLCESGIGNRCYLSDTIAPCRDSRGNTKYLKCCYGPQTRIHLQDNDEAYAYNSRRQYAADATDSCPDFCEPMDDAFAGKGAVAGYLGDSSRVYRNKCVADRLTTYGCIGKNLDIKTSDCAKGCNAAGTACLT